MSVWHGDCAALMKAMRMRIVDWLAGWHAAECTLHSESLGASMQMPALYLERL